MAKLKDRLEHAFDEARILILGASVLLGFQFRAPFETAFAGLPDAERMMRFTGLGLLLLALALLLAPGSFHRLVADGEATPEVHRFTPRTMQVAVGPLALVLGGEVAGATGR